MAYLLALTLVEQQAVEEAASMFLEILPAVDAAFPAEDRRVPDVGLAKANVRYNAGICLRMAGRHADAEPLLVAAFEACAAKHGEHDERALDVAHELVELYVAWGRESAAETWRALLETAGK